MPLYQSILNNFVLDVLSPPGSPEDIACRFVAEFQMFKLDTQYRSLDQKHSANLAAMRTTDPSVYPFTSSILEDYSVLSHADVVKDQSWLQAPVVVLYNVLRHSLNLEALKHFAKLQGLPIICWRNELCGANAAALTAAEINKLYTTHPALSSFFVPGARCYGKTNINTSIGLYNGSGMELYSLCLDPSEDKEAFFKSIRNARPADLVILNKPPFSVVVDITNADPAMYSKSDTLVPGRFVVPLFVDPKPRHESVKEYELNKRIGRTLPGVKYRSHPYDLGYSITYDKTQSKGFSKLILDLQPWPGMSLSYEKLLVGLSRVSTKSNVKILPMHPSQSLNHLFKLKPNVSMLNWLAGYNADGRWCPELARDAVQKNPIVYEKQRQAKSNCPLRQQGSQTKQKTSQPSNSKVSKPNVQLQSKLQMRNQTRKATDDSQLSTFHVVSRFPLNLAHAPRNDADKLYKAFHVPKDGHCLFNAFKFSLQIQQSVAELRQQVVSFIENDTDPMRQLATLNAHIGREQDNNQWIDVELFDPGTDNIPGELDVRFFETWVRYSDHMLGCAWAGQLMFKFQVISENYF
jgi:hypothetical protein